MQKSIAFDLHGTLDSHQEIFNLFTKLVFSTKYKVYVLSGSPADEITDSLSELLEKNYGEAGSFEMSCINSNVGILSVVDTCKFLNIPMTRQPKGKKLNWYCDEELWWPMKSIICKSNEIDFLIDDKIQYSDFFGSTHQTKFCFIKNKYLRIGSKKFAFKNIFKNDVIYNIFK